jgi:hypothetical protein
MVVQSRQAQQTQPTEIETNQVKTHKTRLQYVHVVMYNFHMHKSNNCM